MIEIDQEQVEATLSRRLCCFRQQAKETLSLIDRDYLDRAESEGFGSSEKPGRQNAWGTLTAHANVSGQYFDADIFVVECNPRLETRRYYRNLTSRETTSFQSPHSSISIGCLCRELDSKRKALVCTEACLHTGGSFNE